MHSFYVCFIYTKRGLYVSACKHSIFKIVDIPVVFNHLLTHAAGNNGQKIPSSPPPPPYTCHRDHTGNSNYTWPSLRLSTSGQSCHQLPSGCPVPTYKPPPSVMALATVPIHLLQPQDTTDILASSMQAVWSVPIQLSPTTNLGQSPF